MFPLPLVSYLMAFKTTYVGWGIFSSIFKRFSLWVRLWPPSQWGHLSEDGFCLQLAYLWSRWLLNPAGPSDSDSALIRLSPTFFTVGPFPLVPSPPPASPPLPFLPLPPLPPQRTTFKDLPSASRRWRPNWFHRSVTASGLSLWGNRVKRTNLFCGCKVERKFNRLCS